MTAKPIALFDMDNTLCDWDESMRRGMEKTFPPEYLDKIEDWMTCERRNRPEWVENLMAVIRTQAGWWRLLKPIKLGLQLFQYAEQMGFAMNILTKGPASKPAAWTEKKEWCDIWLSPDLPVTICADKSLVYGKVLVDDYPPYVLSWLEHRPHGLALMPDFPFNQGISHPNLVRVSDTPSSLRVAQRAMKIAYDREEGEPLVLEVY